MSPRAVRENSQVHFFKLFWQEECAADLSQQHRASHSFSSKAVFYNFRQWYSANPWQTESGFLFPIYKGRPKGRLQNSSLGAWWVMLAVHWQEQCLLVNCCHLKNLYPWAQGYKSNKRLTKRSVSICLFSFFFLPWNHLHNLYVYVLFCI